MDDYITVQQPDAPTTFGTKVTQFAFMSRFTGSERKAIKAASATDADVEDVWSLLLSTSYVDLAHPAIVGGMTMLTVKVPTLTAARKDTILTVPVIDPAELPGSVRISYGLPEIPL